MDRYCDERALTPLRPQSYVCGRGQLSSVLVRAVGLRERGSG